VVDFQSEYDPEIPAGSNDQVSNENLVDHEAAQRLKEAVEAAGGPAKVARTSGVPLGTLRGFLRGREIRRAALVATGRGVTRTRRLEAETGFEQPTLDQLHAPVHISTLSRTNYVTIPRYNIVASAGAGAALAEHSQIVEYLAFSEDFLRLRLHRRPEDLVLIEARGDSMEPTIRDGDVLTVDIRQTETLENGRLYVLRIADGMLVKRVELRLQSLVLHSDNKRYAPETVTRAEAEQLHIIGQVLLVSAPPR
jgi:phage repressor protein C with HTH and peptisase S24 domain